MNFYKTTSVVSLSGEVALTDEQARRRARRIEPVKGKKGVYRLRKPAQFKAGEIVGLAQLPPKGLYRSFVGDEDGKPVPVDRKTGEPTGGKGRSGSGEGSGSSSGGANGGQSADEGSTGQAAQGGAGTGEQGEAGGSGGKGKEGDNEATAQSGVKTSQQGKKD